MNTYRAVVSVPEVIIIAIVIACIVWVVSAVQDYKKAVARDTLNQAWREVLNDPHYTERRRLEERKRVEDYDHKHAAAAKL